MRFVSVTVASVFYIMKFKTLLAFVGIVYITMTTVVAQKRLFDQYSTIGGGLGTSTYVGDLAPYSTPIQTVFKTFRWNINANYTRHFTPHLAARVSLTLARIAGDDENYNRGGKPNGQNYIRNLNFRNDLKEVAVTGIYYLVEDGRSSVRRAKFSPYIFLGFGIVAHNPKAYTPAFYEKQQWVSLQPLGTEGQGQPGYSSPYSLVTYSVPFGLGFRKTYNERWDIGVEAGFRFTGSDYLDDVSGRYADPNILKSDLARDLSNRSLEEVAARSKNTRLQTSKNITNLENPFSQPILKSDVGDLRGNSIKSDAYILTSFHINYILPGKIKCPPLR